MPSVRLCTPASVGDKIVRCECGRYRASRRPCGVPEMVARAMQDLGEAIKLFHFGCVAGGGQTNAHGAYIRGASCAFCGNPAEKPPRRWGSQQASNESKEK